MGYYERQQDLGKKMLYLEKMGDREFNDELAMRIKDFWFGKGHTVDVKVVSVPTDEKKQPIWTITSNLIDGVPRRNDAS